MTPNAPPVPTTVPGFVVLDLDLPDRPPLAEAGDYEAGLLTLAAVQKDVQIAEQHRRAGAGQLLQRAHHLRPVRQPGQLIGQRLAAQLLQLRARRAHVHPDQREQRSPPVGAGMLDAAHT